MASPEQALALCLAFVEKIRQSYKDRQECRFYLIRPLNLLAMIYREMHRGVKAVEVSNEALDVLGTLGCLHYLPTIHWTICAVIANFKR